MLIALLALYALLAVADCTSTVIALRDADNSEGNGAMAWLFARIGAIPTMLLLKGGILALTVYSVPLAAVEHPWIMWCVLVPAAVHAYCVVNNVRIIAND